MSPQHAGLHSVVGLLPFPPNAALLGCHCGGLWTGWQAEGDGGHRGLQGEQLGLSPTPCSLVPELQQGRGCQGRKTSTSSKGGLGATGLVFAQPPALIAARSRVARGGGLWAADKGERALPQLRVWWEMGQQIALGCHNLPGAE